VISPTPIEIPLLVEDDDLLAVLKPAGVTVIPARDEPPEMCLLHRLQQQRSERLWVVHRIDRDTSGVLLLARNANAHRRLSLAFEHRQVQKDYLAWTRGVPQPLAGTTSLPLHPARKGRMRPAIDGEPGALASSSDYRTELSAETSLGVISRVRVHPHTGRQHQVRVHLRALGAPLLVDALYGKCAGIDAGALGPDAPPVPRLTLHAARIALSHPRTETPLVVEAPLPEDLAALDRWLERSPDVRVDGR